MEPVVVLILAAVFVGALSQRVTGMGFGLVSGPFLVLLLDPVSGVILVNLCGIIASGTVFARTWREVEWPVFWKLAVGTVAGTVPGALLTTALLTAPLQILIGALIIASLAVSLIIGRFGATIPANFGTQFTSGFVSGTMSAAAGAGGPAVSAYAVLTRWEQRPFAATLQPFLVVGTGSAILAKALLDEGAWPRLDPTIWVGIGIVLVAGLLGGDLLARRLPPTTARIAMIVLAFGGGAATLAKGLGLFG
ncbi:MULTISPECIES: sulfite exporter TauE/SafE family protein [Brevibacterium]|uniref:Probable membrane transporter protein n=1 Tax=Brevibacterium casei TaxID=33889 RepID=A0A269ZBS5_9MICO|nr:sulfite exporter TauE/SafE family protein [Brevibacterium casei]NJE66050.1 sulfite exporter TauE/SafE family protein [Brevibacterium sp. LS14]MBE4694578.1 sulfite exporter TauE/SafE family protein [Brevibacterium casei]MBY3577700.1 sulfite exporter TauE/SafE family protein [Brevibacterium casei]MCT1446542.1 sulfite exporter TauE/SafE family protein [Brevibacterium casei]MDH5149291.1 sulfite exporter TauE/SafE family protein [Brevibacterium casei]